MGKDFFDEVEILFDSRCLYAVIGLEKGCSDEKLIRKAYHKKSLSYHPDRCINEELKESNKKKFQIVTKIYSVLSNKEHKAVYDETGELIDEGDLCEKNRDWEAYWRLLYKKILKKDIEEFENEYRGSEEEAEAVKECYLKFEGNMENIFDNVMCATLDDEERFRKIIEEKIKSENLPEFDAFKNDNEKNKKKRKKKAAKEAKESEELAKELGIDGNTDDLKNLILSRNVSREKEMNSFFDELEAKYAQPKKKRDTLANKPAQSKKRKRK